MSANPTHMPPGTVIHLLGRLTDEVADQVGPVTEALADVGSKQTLIVLDDPARRHLLTRFDARARLVLGEAGGGPSRALPTLLNLLCDEAKQGPVASVHLHGLVPCLLGGYAARFRGLPAPLHFSPYGSRSWRYLRGAAAPLLWTLRPREGEPARRTITSCPAEVSTLQQLTGLPVDLVETSVDSIFFNSKRKESRRPLVVTAQTSVDPRGAAVFTQLAVLLGEEALGMSFNWLGPADRESVAQFTAAGVGRFDAADGAARLARLKPAWVYVAAGSTSGFPSQLVEAMALGLPCVARSTPEHREVLRHEETGLLCRTEDELLASIARLIDSAEIRSRLGNAAREEALHRFHRSTFKASLLASYSAAPVEVTPADTSSAPQGELSAG